MFSYSELKKYGIINNLMVVHPIHDKIIPLDHVCVCLFGVKTVPTTTCIMKLKIDNIIISYNNIIYLIASQFGRFVDRVGCLDKYMNKYIIINYCNFLEKELTGIQKDVHHFNMMFIDYLERIKMIHYNTIIKMIGKDIHNGMMVSYNDAINMICIKYDNIVISYGYDIMDIETYGCLTKPNFAKLADDIHNIMLRNNVDEYVCYNISKITGNEAFAKMLVVAEKQRDVFCIPIEVAASIIEFKNDMKQKEYNEYFTTIYKEGSIWIKDDGIKLNFEGLNNYYLNLENSYLINMDVKKAVCDMYYNITSELIISYKTLYNVIKK